MSGIAYIKECIERDRPLVEEEKGSTFADGGYGREEARRKEDMSNIDSEVDINSLLCSDTICAFAMESVRDRLANMSYDINSKQR